MVILLNSLGRCCLLVKVLKGNGCWRDVVLSVRVFWKRAALSQLNSLLVASMCKSL